MRNNYVAPELEVTYLVSSDILNESLPTPDSTPDNEVDIDGGSLYN